MANATAAKVAQVVEDAKADPRFAQAKDAISKYAKPAAQAVGVSAGVGACFGIALGTAGLVASWFS